MDRYPQPNATVWLELVDAPGFNAVWFDGRLWWLHRGEIPTDQLRRWCSSTNRQIGAEWEREMSDTAPGVFGTPPEATLVA